MASFLALFLLGGVALGAWSGTTVDKTIGDFNGDKRLEYGPGEPYTVREDLGNANPNRTQTRTPVFNPFVQLSDLHVVDEESPARIEQYDDAIPGVHGAYRPQESLMPHTADALVRRANWVRSPVTDRWPNLAIVTGDSADNMHENETEDYIGVLNGDGVDPNSGDPNFRPGPLCLPFLYPRDRYQGVRGDSMWYEPDRSEPGEDGPGYAPADGMRDFSRLFERANRPFTPKGLRYPWLAAFGNHDNLVQGNVPASDFLESAALSCWKIFAGPTHLVQPDPQRHLLSHQEWIERHLADGDGHGFDPANPDIGYYSVSKPGGMRLIGLDSVNELGLANGNIDSTQFEWLDNELQQADEANETVAVFAHHSLVTMDIVFPGQSAHCGLIEQGGTCAQRESLEALFYRHPSAIAFVSGHEHNNRIDPRRQGGGGGNFWELVLASDVDWPQQGGMIEIFNNEDGTFSIFRTILDHAGKPDVGDSPNLFNPLTLASISRELSYNEPQVALDAAGTPSDRNVELIVTR